jgi:hypothetical protein
VAIVNKRLSYTLYKELSAIRVALFLPRSIKPACSQLSASLFTIMGKPVDNHQQACPQLSTAKYYKEKAYPLNRKQASYLL